MRVPERMPVESGELLVLHLEHVSAAPGRREEPALPAVAGPVAEQVRERRREGQVERPRLPSLGARHSQEPRSESRCSTLASQAAVRRIPVRIVNS
jgi:hypothetical protein